MWNRQAIRSRSSFVLALGFGTLIALIAILGIGAIRRARAIYNEMEGVQSAYLQTETFRRDIATDMYLADILVRDYLLDPSPQNATPSSATTLGNPFLAAKTIRRFSHAHGGER